MLKDYIFKHMSKWHVSYQCQKTKNTLSQMSLIEIKGSIILKYYILEKVQFVLQVPMVYKKANATFEIKCISVIKPSVRSLLTS